MLVMGKTVNEVSTGADVFGEGETGASRLYKLGEGKFLSEKFPFPQFFIPVQEDGDYSSTDASAFSISCWMNAARSAGFSPSNQATQREAFSL